MPPSSRPSARTRPAARPGAVRRPRVAGTAASTPGPAPRGARLTTRAVVLVLVALVLLISYASSLRAWLQQRDALQEARTQIATSSRSIDRLEQDKRRYADPAYIEQQARERFGWVLPGEVGYRVLGADGTATGTTPAVTAPGATSGPADQWYGRLWGTVEQAGRRPAPPTPTPAVKDTVIKPAPSEVTGSR